MSEDKFAMIYGGDHDLMLKDGLMDLVAADLLEDWTPEALASLDPVDRADMARLILANNSHWKMLPDMICPTLDFVSKMGDMMQINFELSDSALERYLVAISRPVPKEHVREMLTRALEGLDKA